MAAQVHVNMLYFVTLNKGSQKSLSAKVKDINDEFSKFYDHSNSEVIISLDIPDLDKIMKVLRENFFSTTNWKSLGLSLGLFITTLDEIDKLTRDRCEDALRETLKRWISKEDKVEEKGGPRWSSLLRALKEAKENAVAENIKKKLPSLYA